MKSRRRSWISSLSKHRASSRCRATRARSFPTDKLVELGYLLVDVEPTQAEFDNGSVKAIVIATPRRRAVAIASSFDSLVADDSHFDGDIGWYSYFDFLIAHKSYDECIKYIRFIRAVEEVLVADETIIAIYAGHGINNDEDAFIPELSVRRLWKPSLSRTSVCFRSTNMTSST